jgi:hypothetical protein
MADLISVSSIKLDNFVEVSLRSDNFKMREYERPGQQSEPDELAGGKPASLRQVKVYTV